jgi:hypothetical protein
METSVGQIMYDPCTDHMECTCGNHESRHGFAPVDESLQPIEPRRSLGWRGLYLCLNCRATYRFSEP